jgi:diguanylate cyclase (GGDEF)-like protein
MNHYLEQQKKAKEAELDLKSQHLLEDVKRNMISLLETTKKIDGEYSDDIDTFISKLEVDGLNSDTIAETKRMALVLDNKINTRSFTVRESKNKMKNVLKLIAKKDISQKQSDLLSSISENIDGSSEEDFYSQLGDIFSEFSGDIEHYRQESKKIVGEKHGHFKEGTQDILAGDVGRAAKTICRDVMRMAIQLKDTYPEDKYILEMYQETEKIYKGQSTQFFAVTDILSRLSTRASQLQKQEKLKSQEYLHDINNKLQNVFKTLQHSNAVCNEGENLTNDFNNKLKDDLSKFKNATNGVNDVNKLQELIGENINSLGSQIEDYSNKQKNVQRKQRRQIDSLEIDVKKAIEHQKKLEQSLNEEKEAGGTDELTKIPNRKSYLEYITKVHDIWLKQKNPLSLIVLDIDKFKSINDTFGHNVGDAALRQVSGLIKNIVGDKFFFARIGGEEFVMVCPMLNKSKASLLADRIREKLSGTRFKIGSKKNVQHIQITCSFGVAEFGEDLVDISETFDAADKALYHAKDAGRNTVCVVSKGNIINRTKQFKNRP